MRVVLSYFIQIIPLWLCSFSEAAQIPDKNFFWRLSAITISRLTFHRLQVIVHLKCMQYIGTDLWFMLLLVHIKSCYFNCCHLATTMQFNVTIKKGYLMVHYWQKRTIIYCSYTWLQYVLTPKQVMLVCFACFREVFCWFTNYTN